MTAVPEVRVEFYFDFSSPYSYLSATRIEEICARHQASLMWKPILLGPVLKQAGKAPLFERPIEGDHARVDLRRWAARLDVPFTFPPRFPVNSLSAARGFHAASQAGRAGDYCRRVFDACWAEGKEVSDPAILGSIAAGLGLDPGAFLESIARQEIKDWLRSEVDEAIRRGVFGAPTFFVGGEMFHGNDRLFMVEDLLADRRARDSEGRPIPSTPFNRWFGMHCIERSAGRAAYELQVTPALLNRRGVAHGGAVTSLLDTALGAAVVSGIAPEEWCATLEMSVQFREPLLPGRVVGRGRLLKRGRHAAFAEGEIVDDGGRTLAVGHGTWYIWSRRPRGPKEPAS